MKIGVCLFDEPNIAREGWVSIAGSKAVRVNGIGELRNDVFWVTNLSYFSYRNLNLNQMPNVVDEQYFRTKLTSLCKELSSSENPEELASMAALILDRTHEIGERFLSISANGSHYRYTNILQGCLLGSELRKQPMGAGSLDITEAIQQSTQENQSMTAKSFAKGSKLHSFTFPRAGYAKWLLSKQYPTNSGWTKLNVDRKGEVVIGYEDGIKIKGTDAFIGKLEDLDNSNKAALFRVSIVSMNPQYMQFAKFGSGANKYVRRWASLPEIIDISRYSKVIVMDGYTAQKSPLNLPEFVLADDELQLDYSFSKGLFLENLWAAISSPSYSKTSNTVSAVSAYMRAYDRIACGRAAAAFAMHGFTVGSYGMGRVQVSLRPGEENSSKVIAINNNLLPYMKFMV